MAIFEREGFCPCNSFNDFGLNFKEVEVFDHTKEVLGVLGDRIGYMVYDQDMIAWGTEYPSIVELLLNDEMGPDIAKLLRFLIPECIYAKIGTKILIRDVINPRQIHGLYYVTERTWSFPTKDGNINLNYSILRNNNRYLFYNGNFVVVVEDRDESNDFITIWIFRYPKN